MAQGTSWDYDFLNRLMKDDYYASALNRDYLKEATSEWERNSGDGPQAPSFSTGMRKGVVSIDTKPDPDFAPPPNPYSPRIENAPYDPQAGMHGEMPGPESRARAEAYLRPPPTLVRPGEDGPPMAPPDYGTREWADRQRRPSDDPYGNFGGRRSRVRELGGWKGIVGGFARGAIAGATTPNVVAGGAVDIFRAMQGGGDERLKRDMVTYEMQRQRQNDQRQWENDQQTREYHKAQIKNFESQEKERDVKNKSYENQLALERDEAMKSGDKARIDAVEKKIADYRRRGGGTQKPWEAMSQDERLIAFARAVKQMRGLDEATPDNDPKVMEEPSQKEWAILRYILGGGFGPISQAPPPRPISNDQNVLNPDGTITQQPGNTLEGRRKQYLQALKIVRGLPDSAPDDHEALKAPVTTEEMAQISGITANSKFKSIPLRRPFEQAFYDVNSGKVGIVSRSGATPPGPGATYDYTDMGRVTPPRPTPVPAGAATQQRAQELKEAQAQARMIWQGSRKQLIDEGKVVDASENTYPENVAIYQRSQDSLANDQFWLSSNPRVIELRGPIGVEIAKIADEKKRMSPAPRAGDTDNQFLADAQLIADEERLAKQEGRAPRPLSELKKGGTARPAGSTGGRGPTGAPVAPPAVTPPVAQRLVATGPTGPSGAAYVPPSFEDLPVQSKNPSRKDAPGGGKAKQPPVFYRRELRAFFDEKRVKYGFRDMKAAEEYLKAQGYVIKD